MKRDKNLFARLKKPSKSVEQWADENHIRLQVTPIGDKPKRSLFKQLAVPLTACLLIAFIIPFTALMLPTQNVDNGGDTNQQEKPRYMWQSAAAHYLELEDVLAMTDIHLFNFVELYDSGNILHYVSAFKEYEPISGTDLCVIVNSLVFHFIDGENESAYVVVYMALLYDEYYYADRAAYDNLSLSMTVNGIQFYYAISEFYQGINRAVAKCKIDDIEYIFRIEGFDGITEIDEGTLSFFLNEIVK
jgi:hypothetical protein